MRLSRTLLAFDRTSDPACDAVRNRGLRLADRALSSEHPWRVYILAQRWFWLGCVFETLLGLGALALGLWLDVRWRELWVLSPANAAAGVAFAVPLLAFFGWAMHSRLRPLAQIRELLDERFVPLLGYWSVGQIALISLLAGIGEEALFRGSLQAGLTPALGPLVAGALAAVAFGLGHAITPAYVGLAMLVGALLGWEAHVTGGLLAPSLTHALYDFVALLYLRRGAWSSRNNRV
ncbi:MAG: CPBP family intramembrane metalloprotease [Verrucomicrobia bacterium]|nr:CPBP family intramembrane metalloprotease [Verrucomicrobiota bacterium]